MKLHHVAVKTTLPGREKLISEILVVLKSKGTPMTAAEMDRDVIARLHITKEQLSILRSGTRTEFAYSMAWARQTAKTRGLVSQPKKGFWEIASW